MPPPTPHPTWKQAWDAALYGADGFFRREAPAAHFRTSVHASPLFARALARMTREAGLDTVVDIGAGRGELLTELHALDPDLDLLGVEVAARPAGLDPAIAWTTALPEAVDGLVVANEWLDNIPCHVVEVAPDGRLRVVHVDPATGEETLGQPLAHSTVAPSLAAWVERWWPLDAARAGHPRRGGQHPGRGLGRRGRPADPRDRRRGGLRPHRRVPGPPSARCAPTADGQEVDVLPDGSRDVTAHVAVDAVADRVGGVVRRQRDVLHELGVSGERPDLALATSDPAGYVRALAGATEAAELTAVGGLGDFFWVVTVRD